MQTERIDSNSDISLFELLNLFYQKKILLILTTLLGLAIGFAAIFFSTPVYEAAIKLSAATEGDIAAFNLGRSWDKSPLKPMSLHDIYLIFNDELLSEAVKKTFFNQYYLPSLPESLKQNNSREQIYASFTKNFAVVENPKTSSDRFAKFTVAIRGNNAQQVARWLAQFVDLVKTQTLNVVLNNIKQQNAVIVYNLQHQIDMARAAANVERDHQIAQLKERIHLAQLASRNANDLFDSAINSPAPPNPEVLRAQVRKLAAQKPNDALVPNLRELQAQLGFYKSLAVNPNDVAVFHLDGVIDTPNTPIAPKKRLIMMVSLVLGFMAGVLGVMLQVAWCREQYRKAALT